MPAIDFPPAKPGWQRPLKRRALLNSALLTTLAACSGGTPGGKSPGGNSGDRVAASPTPTTSPVVRSDGPIVWANWPGYIDRSHGHRPTLEAFVDQSGIAVDYQEVINDNAEFLDTVADGLHAGTPIGYDLITPTSWVAAQLVARGQVQPFGPTTGADKVISALAAPSWDPEQRFAMPWQAGLTGIAYDARRVDRAIGSISELFERDDLRGGVGLLTEWNDTLGLAMLSEGMDLTDLSEEMVDNGVDYIKARATAGQFKGYYGNDYVDALASGEVVATIAWSGDVMQAQLDNPYLKFVVPEEGLMIWSDNLMVPRGSQQAGAVAKLVDYYYQPDVAARLAAWVNYICPVVGAQAEMEKFAPHLAENPLIFPDQSIVDVAYLFPSLPDPVMERLETELSALA